MKDTKQKILSKALELYNTEGCEKVTVRHIASALGMSHGNLCYHFANDAVLVAKLYEQLVGELDQGINQVSVQDFTLHDLMQFGEQTFRAFYKYKFLMLDFVRIMRDHPSIKDHFKVLIARRKQEFLNLLRLMQLKGYLEEEIYRGHFESCIELMNLSANFWMSEAEILMETSDEVRIKHYSKVAAHLLLPMLTPLGRKEFLVHFNLEAS